jgi:hypothetical protein
VFRAQFDPDELRRVDCLMGKLEALAANGLFTRKLGKWVSVLHFRATQLATSDGFAFSAAEVARIKHVYFHAHAKTEQEADRQIARHGLRVAPARPSLPPPERVDEGRLAREIYEALAASVANRPPGTVAVVHTNATWRFVSGHVVAAAEIDDPDLFDAAFELAAIDVELESTSDQQHDDLLAQAADAEARVDREFRRVLNANQLTDTVDRLLAKVTTSDQGEAKPGRG